MTNPLHAEHYADQALQVTAEIVHHERIARDTYQLRFQAPEMAARFQPGQFLMMRIAGLQDPLIGRALALYDVIESDGRPDAIDVVYIAKGKFTSALCQLRQGQVEVWGPLGNGFQIPPCERLIMVAGGIGQTPFLAVAKEVLGKQAFGGENRTATSVDDVVFCYGARNAAYFAGLADFEAAGVDLRLATDDGSRGRRGLVTELLDETLAEKSDNVCVLCCGPEPMMEAAAAVAARHQAPCHVSLETPMACGIGVCFTCVAKVKDASGEWDYKRTCVEGPVFNADCIEW